MSAAEPQRSVLPLSHVHVEVRERIVNFHKETVDEIRSAIASNAVVVVGMAQNPHVTKARKLLTAANVDFKYLEYGSYLNSWRRRSAIKMWSGWSTLPQVFVNGILVGGASDLATLIERGALSELIGQGREN